MNVLVLNGPNLNLLGEREPAIYGTTTLADIEAMLRTHAEPHGAVLRFVQSNHEGVLIDALHEHRSWAAAVLFNPGAFTHYSWALRDAVASIAPPVFEVHLSDPATREAWRRVSVLADVRAGVFAGMGAASYTAALSHAIASSSRAMAKDDARSGVGEGDEGEGAGIVAGAARVERGA